MVADKIPKKLIKAVIYTINNLKVEGLVFAGSDIRLSDELNLTGKKLIYLKDATVTVVGSEISTSYEMTFINKDQIVLVATQDKPYS
jgi:hypothetical protein